MYSASDSIGMLLLYMAWNEKKLTGQSWVYSFFRYLEVCEEAQDFYINVIKLDYMLVSG